MTGQLDPALGRFLEETDESRRILDADVAARQEAFAAQYRPDPEETARHERVERIVAAAKSAASLAVALSVTPNTYYQPLEKVPVTKPQWQRWKNFRYDGYDIFTRTHYRLRPNGPQIRGWVLIDTDGAVEIGDPDGSGRPCTLPTEGIMLGEDGLLRAILGRRRDGYVHEVTKTFDESSSLYSALFSHSSIGLSFGGDKLTPSMDSRWKVKDEDRKVFLLEQRLASFAKSFINTDRR
jgi:hypothetical protein